MASAFALVFSVSAAFVFFAYRYSTKTAWHLTLVTAFFWTLGMALLSLNTAFYPNDDTMREYGKWIAVIPFAIAIPLSAISIAFILTGLNTKKEA